MRLGAESLSFSPKILCEKTSMSPDFAKMLDGMVYLMNFFIIINVGIRLSLRAP
jgi:hypothetical protein